MKFRFIFFFLLLIIFSSVYGFEEGFELSSEGTINYIGSGEEGALYDFYLCDNCEVSESTKNILMEEFPKLAERLEVGKIPSPELKAELNEEIIDEIDKKNGAFLKEVEGIKEHLKKKLKEDEKYRIKLVEGEYIHLENKEGKDFIKIPMGCYSFESTQFSLDFLAKGKCKKDLEIMGSRIHSVSKGTQISTYSVDSEIPTYGSNIERIKLFGEGTFLYGSSEIRTLSEKSEIRLEKEGNMARFSISSSENLELKLYGQKFDKLYAAHFTIDETKDELISGEFYNGDEEAIYDLSFFGESLVFQLEPLGSLFFERDEEEGLLVGGKKAIFRFENKEIFSPNFQATFDTKNKNFKRIYFSSGSRYEEQRVKQNLLFILKIQQNTFLN